jgi:hypothetical protein
MKSEKHILTVLCLGVCIWSATMIVGVFGLARTQGPSALWALLEVAAFVGAGLLPLLLIWKSDAGHEKVIVGIWTVCVGYVNLLALNALRLGLFAKASVRLALWIVIAILLVRALRATHKHA